MTEQRATVTVTTKGANLDSLTNRKVVERLVSDGKGGARLVRYVFEAYASDIKASTVGVLP